MKTKKILLILPDLENELPQKIKEWGFDTVVTNSHLHGLKLLDEERPNMIISFLKESDIDGIEFSKIVRFREKNGILEYKYIILILSEEEISTLLSNFYEIDDIIVYPILEQELKWRIINGFKRMENIKQIDKIDNALNILNQNGIKEFLKKEMNRAIRNNKEVSILILKFLNLEKIESEYSEYWIKWLENVFINQLKPKIRNFEEIGKLENGVYCIISLTSIDELKELANRLKIEHNNFLEEHKFLKNLPSFYLEINGINFSLDLHPSEIEKAIEFIMVNFLRSSVLFQKHREKPFIKVKLTKEKINSLKQL